MIADEASKGSRRNDQKDFASVPLEHDLTDILAINGARIGHKYPNSSAFN